MGKHDIIIILLEFDNTFYRPRNRRWNARVLPSMLYELLRCNSYMGYNRIVTDKRMAKRSKILREILKYCQK